MQDKIQALFHKYQQEYPLYTRDAIIDVMLDDGVITYDIAQKVKSGVSLFLLDNKLAQSNADNDVNMTKIMGGNFTKNKTPKTYFNRAIDSPAQREVQGDCWLLSDLNSLKQKSWGKKAIYDAILPDSDGSGGVTVKFKGSPLKNKNIHITAAQIDTARKSGNYSKGDDDVIAFELAVEKTFREMVKKGMGKRIATDEELNARGPGYRSFIYYGIKTGEFDQYPISKLLGINAKEINLKTLEETPANKKVADKILRLISANSNNVSATCDFNFNLLGGYCDKNGKNHIHGQHAYAVKSLQYGRDVKLVDPYFPDEEITVPWDVFKKNILSFVVSFKDSKTSAAFANSLPKNYKEMYNKYIANIRNEHKKIMRQYEQAVDSVKAEEAKKIRIEAQNKRIKRQQAISKNKKNIVYMLNQAYKTNDKKMLFKAVCKLDKDVVVDILDKYPDLVARCDKAYYGWGQGSQKSFLISHIINPLADKAKEKGINDGVINDFREKCNDELDAIFYTNEKVIIEQVNKLKRMIKSK